MTSIFPFVLFVCITLFSRLWYNKYNWNCQLFHTDYSDRNTIFTLEYELGRMIEKKIRV